MLTSFFFVRSLGPFEAAAATGAGGEMVSRRRILSRSRDDLTQAFATQVEEEEDVWYQKEKLYKVRVKCVLDIGRNSLAVPARRVLKITEVNLCD